MYETKQYAGSKTIAGIEITLFYSQKNAEHEDQLVYGKDRCDSVIEQSGYYEAHISGKGKVFHKSKNEPSDEELEFHLKNYLSSPLNKILSVFGF